MANPGLFHRLPLGPLAQRPRLVAAILFGATAALLLGVIPNPLRWSTRAVLSWDLGCAWFVAACMLMMAESGNIRQRAAVQDDGRHVILALVVTACAASLGAIAAELAYAKDHPSADQALHVALVFATVAASWFVVQLIFALHYAHEFYAPALNGSPRGGLSFPGEEPPDYWDFLYFSLVLGVAAQTADVSFTSRSLRRVGALHSLTAFVFNTVVLAMTVSLLAGLF